MSESQRPYHPALEVTITLPLDVVEAVERAIKRLHIGNIPAKDRGLVETFYAEVEQVRKMVGPAAD
jgi:hypothetical protein